jgi:hypothetical protein
MAPMSNRLCCNAIIRAIKKITNEAEALRKRRETKMSILGTVMKSIMASREREAQRYVARVLAGMDDVTLNALGKSREGLKKGPF